MSHAEEHQGSQEQDQSVQTLHFQGISQIAYRLLERWQNRKGQNETIANMSESEFTRFRVPIEVRSVLNFSLLKEATTRKVRQLYENAKTFPYIPYLFSERAGTGEAFQVVEDISKQYLKEERARIVEKYGEDGILVTDEKIDTLHPLYIQRTKGRVGEQQSGGGVSPTSGLLLIKVDPKNPLMIAQLVPHEFSHGEGGLQFVLDKESESSLDDDVIMGLERLESGSARGGLLENAMAEWDEAEVYKRIRDRDFMRKIVRAKQRRYRQILKRNENDQTKLTILSAQRAGLPEHIIEAHADLYNNLEQMIVIWKLAHIIGAKLHPNKSTDMTQENYDAFLFQEGRDYLLQSRMRANEDAIHKIEEIFGERDAFNIVKTEQHPRYLGAMINMLEQKEAELGLTSNELES